MRAAQEFTTKSLHANFRLSRAGEELGLFLVQDGSIVAVDSVRFGIQEPDVSWGRRLSAPEEGNIFFYRVCIFFPVKFVIYYLSFIICIFGLKDFNLSILDKLQSRRVYMILI